MMLADVWAVISPRKTWLFIKRGFLMTLSYRVALLVGLLSGFIGVLQFGIMASFLSRGNSFPLLAPYGGDLLAFLVIGNVFNAFVGVALNGFQTTIRNEQQMGTLEYLMMGNMPLAGIILHSGLWSFINTLFNVALLLGLISLLFNIQLSVNLLTAAVILVLAIVALSGIGLASAGVIMVTKQGDPINWIFVTLSTFLSGVLFPVEYFPKWMQSIAYVLPTTHALRAMRLALIKGVGLAEIGAELAFLGLACLVTVPIGLLVFTWGFRQARIAGSLTHY